MWRRAEKPKTKSIPMMSGSQSISRPPLHAAKFNPEILVEAPRSALELLELQRLYGNRGTGRILQTMEAGEKSGPVIQGVWKDGEKQYFKRKGYKEGLVSCESWDQAINGKIWYRYKPDYVWFYLYNIVGDSDEEDEKVESRWLTEAEFTELGKQVPECLLSPEVVQEEAAKDRCRELVESVQEKIPAELLMKSQWDVFEYHQAYGALNRSGICNVLTASWLLNWLQPGAEKQMGFGAETLKSLLVLKKFFNAANRELKPSWGEESFKATLAFMDYSKKNNLGIEWLENLQTFFVKDAQLESLSFIDFVKKWNGSYQKSEPLEGTTEKKQVARIKAEEMRKYLDKVLQPFIHSGKPFQGLVAITAWMNAGWGKSGHELAFRTSQDRGKAWFYDQSYGLSKEMEINNFTRDFANYLQDGYVDNPICIGAKPTDMIKLEVIMFNT